MTRERFGTPSNTVHTAPLSLPPRGLAFPKSSRLLRPSEYRQVYERGFRISSPCFAVFCLTRPGLAAVGSSARIGFTVPRALGKATVRNRIKRRVREAFRRHLAELAPRWEIVVNPRRGALEAGFTSLEREVNKVIERCKGT